MRICQVEISGFRGIEHASVVLPQHGVIVGPNNAGKSTVVDSLALLFGRERMTRPISDWDFFGGTPQPDSRFSIIGTLTDLGSDDPLDFPRWFAGNDRGRPVWWDETTATINACTEQPQGSRLAVQVAVSARYDDETCEFEAVRYFYDGDSDPFTDGYTPLPPALLREVGLFFLPCNRDWDRMLSFASSSLLRAIRESNAIPGASIEVLKGQLRSDVEKVEDAEPFREMLLTAEQELKSFVLIQQDSRIVYRPTALDAISVMQSLVAHIGSPPDQLIPISRQGAGTVSLQAFLLLLAFAQQRKSSGQNFILVAEEPELHLHPSLHQRLVGRIRAMSTQSIVTTQSPLVAAGYQPAEVVFVSRLKGCFTARRLRTEPVADLQSNALKKLYLSHRSSFYDALMGAVILVPEGVYDGEWLALWQQMAYSWSGASAYACMPITVVPTSDAAISETYKEVAACRADALPIVDGDPKGQQYLSALVTGTPPPLRVVELGEGAAIECLAAWFLEPALINPSASLTCLLSGSASVSLENLQDALIDHKKDRDLRERLVWEALGTSGCCERVSQFIADLGSIASGSTPTKCPWVTRNVGGSTQVYTAAWVRRA